jgi:hypothetical protein
MCVVDPTAELPDPLGSLGYSAPGSFVKHGQGQLSQEQRLRMHRGWQLVRKGKGILPVFIFWQYEVHAGPIRNPGKNTTVYEV